MQLRLSNGYRHDDNEVAITAITRQSEQNGGGITSCIKTSWQLEGILQGSTQAELTQKMLILEAAYRNQGFSAVFFDNSGAPTAHSLGGPASRNGCTTVSGVNWIMRNGAEYSTFRSYSLVIEAESDNRFVDIWNFSESISRVGNTGPRTVWKHNLNDVPQKQLTWLRTTQRVIQRGQIVGMFRYVAPPPPMWPQAMLNDVEELTYGSPKRFGPIGRPYHREFPTEYAYYFESNVPLFGFPTKWTS